MNYFIIISYKKCRQWRDTDLKKKLQALCCGQKPCCGGKECDKKKRQDFLHLLCIEQLGLKVNGRCKSSAEQDRVTRWQKQKNREKERREQKHKKQISDSIQSRSLVNFNSEFLFGAFRFPFYQFILLEKILEPRYCPKQTLTNDVIYGLLNGENFISIRNRNLLQIVLFHSRRSRRHSSTPVQLSTLVWKSIYRRIGGQRSMQMVDRRELLFRLFTCCEIVGNAELIVEQERLIRSRSREQIEITCCGG